MVRAKDTDGEISANSGVDDQDDPVRRWRRTCVSDDGRDKKFVPEPFIDYLRYKLRQEADIVWIKLHSAIKGSKAHLRLVEKFNKVNLRTVRLLKKYNWYFVAKRAHFRDMALQGGLGEIFGFGDPKEDGRHNNRFADKCKRGRPRGKTC